MFDNGAVMSDPCQVCRVMVLVLAGASLAQPLHPEAADLFDIRANFGDIPPAVDIAIMIAFALAVWVLCERVVVSRLIGGRGEAGGDR